MFLKLQIHKLRPHRIMTTMCVTRDSKTIFIYNIRYCTSIACSSIHPLGKNQGFASNTMSRRSMLQPVTTSPFGLEYSIHGTKNDLNSVFMSCSLSMWRVQSVQRLTKRMLLQFFLGWICKVCMLITFDHVPLCW